MNLSLRVLALMALIAVGNASARAGFVIDFEFDSGFLPSLTFSGVDGADLDVTVSATRADFVPGVGLVASPALIDFDGSGSASGPGLGVVNATGGPGDDDLEPPAGGLVFSGETLLFSFFRSGVPVEVSLDQILFANADGNDNFDLLLEGQLELAEEPIPAGGAFSPATSLVAQTFGVRADGVTGLGPNLDNFKLASIEITAIPEPSALLGLTLIGLAMGGRRVTRK